MSAFGSTFQPGQIPRTFSSGEFFFFLGWGERFLRSPSFGGVISIRGRVFGQGAIKQQLYLFTRFGAAVEGRMLKTGRKKEKKKATTKKVFQRQT